MREGVGEGGEGRDGGEKVGLETQPEPSLQHALQYSHL